VVTPAATTTSNSVLGVSSTSLAFIEPPAGGTTDPTGSSSTPSDLLTVATGGTGSGLGAAMLSGFHHHGMASSQQSTTDTGIPASGSSPWTTLPMFSTTSATDQAKAGM
jgi:hypothetical protein